MNPKQKLIAVEAVTQVFEPEYEWGDLLYVISAGYEKDEGSDGSKSGGLLDVIHEDGSNSKAKTLGYENTVEDNEKREEEGGGMRIKAAHPIDDDNKSRGEG